MHVIHDARSTQHKKDIRIIQPGGLLDPSEISKFWKDTFKYGGPGVA
jgi:hypothetical protein